MLPSKTRYALGKTRDAIESFLLGAASRENVFHVLLYMQRAIERPGELSQSVRSGFESIIGDIVDNNLALEGRVVTDSDILRLLKAIYRLHKNIEQEIYADEQISASDEENDF